jgi:hypothetical protein
MVAIGLGVLCGYPLYRSLARTLGWLQELGSGEGRPPWSWGAAYQSA